MVIILNYNLNFIEETILSMTGAWCRTSGNVDHVSSSGPVEKVF